MTGPTPEHMLDETPTPPEPTPTPTQVRHPIRAALRTALAYIAAAIVVVPIAWQIITDGLHDVIPPDVMAALGGVIGSILAIATAITRIMAIPQVNDWLTSAINLGAGPREGSLP